MITIAEINVIKQTSRTDTRIVSNQDKRITYILKASTMNYIRS
jgi:hypothetical protein